MKSRLATMFTLFALVGGTGGALAVAGSSGGSSSHNAAGAEYKPGKGCGDKNHTHTGSNGKQKPCPKKKEHKGSTKGKTHKKSSKTHKSSSHKKSSKTHKSSSKKSSKSHK